MSPLKPLLALAGATLLIGASHDSGQALLARTIGDRVAGTPQTCINGSDTDGPTVIDHRTLLYRTGGTIYRNDLPAECETLTQSATIIVEPFGSQLCEHDRFRTRDLGENIPSSYCFLGKFTPYTVPKH